MERANVAGVPLDQFCEMRGHYNHETAMKEIAESVKTALTRLLPRSMPLIMVLQCL